MITVIIGPRSVGKSSVGAILASRWNVEYHDLDAYVDERLGGIDEFLETKSMRDYREVESDLLVSFVEGLPGDCVISLGGGTIASEFQEYNRKNELTLGSIMRKMVYLCPATGPEEAIAILWEHEQGRIDAKTVEETRMRYFQRISFYERLADVTILVGKKSVPEVVQIIKSALTHRARYLLAAAWLPGMRAGCLPMRPQGSCPRAR